MSSAAEQTLLVTGANGFIAQHIIRTALDRGYKVRGTGRSESSLSKLKDTFPSHAANLSFAIVKDITDVAAYADAFDGVTGVIHTASPFVLDPEDNVKDILDPAVKGAVGVLEAAKRYGPSVRRVVTTSSFAANLDLAQGLRPGYVYSEKDWNPMTWDEASKADGVSAYCASKALAEKAMWDWVDANQPSFTLASMNPAWVFGPSVGGVSLGHLGESTGALWALVGADKVPPFDFGGFIDVRAVAEAHVLAYETPAAAGERFVLATHFDYQTALDHLHDELPELKGRIPAGEPGKIPDSYVVDGSKAEKVLGVKYIPLSRTLKDSLSQLLEAEKSI